MKRNTNINNSLLELFSETLQSKRWLRSLRVNFDWKSEWIVIQSQQTVTTEIKEIANNFEKLSENKNAGIIISTTAKNITFELWVGSHGYLHGKKT